MSGDTIETEDGHRHRNYAKHLRYFWSIL